MQIISIFGILGVLFGVLGFLVGMLGVLVGVLGVFLTLRNIYFKIDDGIFTEFANKLDVTRDIIKSD